MLSPVYSVDLYKGHFPAYCFFPPIYDTHFLWEQDGENGEENIKHQICQVHVESNIHVQPIAVAISLHNTFLSNIGNTNCSNKMVKTVLGNREAIYIYTLCNIYYKL